MVRFGGMIVDCGGGLSAQVAESGVEIQGADAVGTVRTGELHATLDALDSVGFHCLNCSPFVGKGGTRWWGGEGNKSLVGDFLAVGSCRGFARFGRAGTAVPTRMEGDTQVASPGLGLGEG